MSCFGWEWIISVINPPVNFHGAQSIYSECFILSSHKSPQPQSIQKLEIKKQCSQATMHMEITCHLQSNNAVKQQCIWKSHAISNHWTLEDGSKYNIIVRCSTLTHVLSVKDVLRWFILWRLPSHLYKLCQYIVLFWSVCDAMFALLSQYFLDLRHFLSIVLDNFWTLSGWTIRLWMITLTIFQEKAPAERERETETESEG